MRTAVLVASLAVIVWLVGGSASAQPFHAGISRITVGGDAPFDVLVWYPTQEDEARWQAGPFTVSASRDAAIAQGRFPIILFSHGGGSGGGSPLVLTELMAGLARAGFIVVAPFHGNTKHSLVVRPQQVDRALSAILADPRISAHADPTRMGMIGFSLGGAVTLLKAGAVPNLAHFAAYCAVHSDDLMACGPGPGGGSANAAPARDAAASALPSIDPLPLKAIVLLDPGPVAYFDPDGLSKINLPVLLYRPEQSALRAEGNALALAAALPRPRQLETIPGGHFIFVDVCSAEFQAQARDACEDPQGVDRASVHARIKVEIAKFFHDNL